MDGLLLNITGWRPEEIEDGVALTTELGRWPGGRALYDPRPGEPRTPGPGVSCRFQPSLSERQRLLTARTGIVSEVWARFGL